MCDCQAMINPYVSQKMGSDFIVLFLSLLFYFIELGEDQKWFELELSRIILWPILLFWVGLKLPYVQMDLEDSLKFAYFFWGRSLLKSSDEYNSHLSKKDL